MRNLFSLMIVAALLMAAVTTSSCTKEGPAGPAGQNGKDGQDGKDGKDGQEGALTVTFNSNGGNAVSPEKVIEGGKAREPKDPVKSVAESDIETAGLYKSKWIFEGWFGADDKLFDFDEPITKNITLAAKWKLPIVDLTGMAGANIVERAVAYAKANADAYVLAINNDFSVAPQTLNTTNLELSIIGLGSERKINLGAQGALFTVGASDNTGISLTLGNNITLVGRADNNNTVVTVNNGANFVMLDGSKITGNTSSADFTAGAGAAVNITGSGTTFTMKGGTVTGNTSTYTTNLYAGGVCITSNGSFYMEGGSIKGNNGLGGDITFAQTASNFTLSGDAEVGTLTVNYGGATSYSTTSIASGWTGSVATLNLRANGTTTIDGVISAWYNATTPRTVLKGGGSPAHTLTAADVAKFALVKFLCAETIVPSQPIGEAGAGYKIENSGADIGKLVLK